MWWSKTLVPVRHQGRTGHAPGGRPSPSRPRCRLLAERTSRGLDADRVTVLGMAGVRLPQDRYRRRSSSVSPYPRGRAGCRGSGSSGRRTARSGRGRARSHRSDRGASTAGRSSAAGARLMAVPGWPLPALCTSPWPEPGRYRPSAGRGRSIRSRWTFPPAASSTCRPQPSSWALAWRGRPSTRRHRRMSASSSSSHNEPTRWRLPTRRSAPHPAAFLDALQRCASIGGGS